MTNKINRNIFLIIIITINLAVDQISKYYARIYLMGRPAKEIVGRLFQLTYAENDGAFLSLGSNLPQPWKTYILVLFPALAIIAGILYLIFGKKVSFKQAVCVACIIGGGIGNVWDRAVHEGAVTDFLYFEVNRHLRTGVLNIADLSITFGAILLFIFQYREEKKEKLKELKLVKDNDGTLKADC